MKAEQIASFLFVNWLKVNDSIKLPLILLPMKTILIIFLLLPSILFSQDNVSNNPKVKLGLTFSASPSIQIFTLFDSEDDPTISGYDFFSAGAMGLFSLNKFVAVETGFLYSRGRFEIVPWGAHPQVFSEHLSLVSIPVELRSTFFRYFFATGGIQFDFDFSEPGELQNQSGLGILLGTGFNYDFKNGLSLFLEPKVKIHSMISYTRVFANDRIIETSIRLGLLYSL